MRTTQLSAIGDTLFGQTRGRVLALLYGKPDQSFYVRQIARDIGVSVGALQRELETLTRVGLIARKAVGNQIFYQANQHAPVFAELRSLVQKTLGAEHLLRSALAPIADKISVAFVYGSLARGDEKAESDIDVMVIGDVTVDELISQLSHVDVTVGRPVNPTVYSEAEFSRGVSAGNHFLNAVMRGEKIFLIGDDHELGELAQQRMAKAGAVHRRRGRSSAEHRRSRNR